MNENLPINVDDDREVGTITYANEVIQIIAGMAANEVDGVASMTNTGGIADLFGRAKPVTRGVKVEVGTEEASVDLALTVEYGKPIQKVCVEVQESVRKSIEMMTGLHVVKVDVHVTGVSFEKETQEIEQGYVKAAQAGKTLDEPVYEDLKPAAKQAEWADDGAGAETPDNPGDDADEAADAFADEEMDGETI